MAKMPMKKMPMKMDPERKGTAEAKKGESATKADRTGRAKGKKGY